MLIGCMGRDKLCRGVALRLCLLLVAVCVCAEVFLELGRRAGPQLPSGRPAQSPRAQVRLPPTPGTSTAGGGANQDGANKSGGSAKRKVSDVRPGPDRGTAGHRPPQPATSCCPVLPHYRKIPRWRIELQPWASPGHTLEDEAIRFLDYIKTPQVSCGPAAGQGLPKSLQEPGGPWLVCMDDRYSLGRRIRSRQCRVYSLGMGMDSKQLEMSLANAGCEVHCFDPSIKKAHLQDSNMWHHRLSVYWRDPNPAIPAYRQHSNTKKLATILNDFGHRQIDVLKADVESAEWKILENLILEDVLGEIGQLLLEVHLHWPGFEVSGDDSSVVRYWYSLLRELERHHFRLFYSHSDARKPRLFLHRNLLNASSTYTLGWINSSPGMWESLMDPLRSSLPHTAEPRNWDTDDERVLNRPS